MRSTVATALTSLALLTGCGGDGDGGTGTAEPPATETQAKARPPGDEAPRPRAPEVECPPDLASCRTASGEIVYVERVDPDGDGDAHFVLLSDESITGPGISVIDVRLDLRPDPLPGPGDLLAAAGPVYEGSYGQRQIQAEVVEFARAP